MFQVSILSSFCFVDAEIDSGAEAQVLDLFTANKISKTVTNTFIVFFIFRCLISCEFAMINLVKEIDRLKIVS